MIVPVSKPGKITQENTSPVLRIKICNTCNYAILPVLSPAAFTLVIRGHT